MSIHQQALRGQAQVALLRGDRIKAKQQYEAILGAALMGRGVAEHWAHAEYGWMLFEDGQLQVECVGVSFGGPGYFGLLVCGYVGWCVCRFKLFCVWFDCWVFAHVHEHNTNHQIHSPHP